VLDCITGFSGVNDAQTLYCTLLNYDYQDLPIPVDDWSKLSRRIIVDGKIIARKSGFNILYFTIRKLARTNERTVLQEILKRFPDCAVVFTDEEENEFHITSPKYEPESRYKFVIRRYVVGKYEKLRTASERLCLIYALDTDTATELKAKHDDAFNVEAVTKQFYTEYKTILGKREGELQSQGIGDKKTAKGFAQQFLNRLMFLYFIQKRGWLNNDGRFVWSLVKRYKNTGGTPNGIYKDWLEPLFFYSFNNKEIPDSYGNLPAELREIFEKMPYLNGGLFLKNELDTMGYRLDDALIYKLVDIDGGLLERYNFTIREDLPFDVDVAVDPEMLGKVYESLILEEERGEAGIFYTPRIEVDFMCRQTIMEYLTENTGIAQGKLISFIYGTEEDRTDVLSAEEAQKVGNALFNAKIVDPACGSGAFLVGMLHVLMELYSLILKKLDKRLNLFEIKKEIINNNLYGADIKDWAVRVAELRLWLTLLVETPDSEIKLNAKKPLLPNLTLKLRCGDSLVQEIAGKPLSLREYMFHLHPICKTGIMDLYKKLREDKKNYYYSRADDPEVLSRIKRKEVEIIRTLVDSEIKLIDLKLKPLAATQQQFGSVQTAITISEKKRSEDKLKLEKEKERLKDLLETLESGVLKNRFFWEIDFAEVFADGGFDIVIANPPYVRQEKIAPLDIPEEEITKEIKKEYKEALVRSVKAQWKDEFKKNLKSDLYVYFYYHGLSLLRPGGVFCFISSNSWLDVGFGANLQEFLLRNIEVKAIYDNHAKRSFEEASINTIIAVFKRPEEQNLADKLAKFVAFKKPFEVVITETNLKAVAGAKEKLKKDDFRCITMTQGELWKEGLKEEETNQAEITGSEFIGNYAGNKWGGKYLRAPDIFFTILEKGKGKLVRLGDVAEVRFGIKTGANEFFYVEDVTDKNPDLSRVENIRNLQTSEEIKDAGLRVIKPSKFKRGDKDYKLFLVEEEFLKPIIFSLKQLERIDFYNEEVFNKLAIFCHLPRNELKNHYILDYIGYGESQEYDERPTCKSRDNWYMLGKNWKPAELIFPSKIGERFLVYLNTHELFEDKKQYGISANGIKKGKLLWYVNSTLFRFYIELTSRQLTGAQAIADIDVRVVEDALVIDIPFDKGDYIVRPIKSIFEECGIDKNKPIKEQKPNPLPDRAELDNIVFDELGLTEEERKEVYWAVCELVKQRLEKARSLKRG